MEGTAGAAAKAALGWEFCFLHWSNKWLIIYNKISSTTLPLIKASNHSENFQAEGVSRLHFFCLIRKEKKRWREKDLRNPLQQYYIDSQNSDKHRNCRCSQILPNQKGSGLSYEKHSWEQMGKDDFSRARWGVGGLAGVWEWMADPVPFWNDRDFLLFLSDGARGL